MDRTKTITIGDVCEIICKHCVKAHGGCSYKWNCPLLTEIAKYIDRKTEPSNSEKPNNSTISKMEQVEQRSCDTCKGRDIEGWKNPCLGCTGFAFYEPKDEPQTHEICTNTHECVKDTHDKAEPQTAPYVPIETFEDIMCYKDEPQTDCAWK